MLGILVTAVISSCCQFKTVTCTDGNPVNIPKNSRCLQKETDATAHEFDVKLKATVDVLTKVQVTADNIEVKNKVIELKEKLTNETQRFQSLLLASTNALMLTPCNSAKAHADLLQTMSKNQTELEQLRIELAAGQQGSKSPTPPTSEAINKSLADFDRGYVWGREDGLRVGRLMRAIKEYQVAHGSYPASLAIPELKERVEEIGASKLKYELNDAHGCILSFAGQDGLLGTADDKVHFAAD